MPTSTAPAASNGSPSTWHLRCRASTFADCTRTRRMPCAGRCTANFMRLARQSCRQSGPSSRMTTFSQPSLTSASGAKSTVPVLSTVRESHKAERLVRLTPVQRQRVGFAAIGPGQLQSDAHVRQSAPAGSLRVERMRDLGVETCARDVEKMPPPEMPDVHRNARSVGGCGEGGVCLAREAEAAGKSIAEPSATIPRAVGVPISGPATSLAVPSPPHAMTTSNWRATNPRASSIACPGAVVTAVSRSMVRRRSAKRRASATRSCPERARRPRDPETGLTTTPIRIAGGVSNGNQRGMLSRPREACGHALTATRTAVPDRSVSRLPSFCALG